MVADSDKCFRVSGIPNDYTERQIKDLLAKELYLDDDVLIRIFSLARSPLRPNELIATLSLSQIPEGLSKHGQQHIDIPPTSPESWGPRRQVVLDSHFQGFTPLHTAKDHECYMDIVALSGLNGHAFGSFKARGGSHMWLRDALPLDMQKARIFIYGYDTSPEAVSFQNIWDLESTFRHGLRMLRARSDSTRRPFVIVAHSLGGIIAKAAVIKMAESTIEGDNAAYRSLRGAFFFGVPSQGMEIESLITMVPTSEMRALLSSLDKNNSPTLRELGEDFPSKIKELRGFQVFNFYETRESPTAKRNDRGHWEMTGPPTVLVTPFSATQGKLGNGPGHRVIAINRTHSEMIKFSGTHDNDYETTLECMKEIEERIGREGSVWPRDPMSKDEQDCLQSISFLEQHSREFDPKINAAEGTCTWIHENKDYRSWISASSGPLWIMGPPGAGKSTLMKFLMKTEREKKRDREIVAAFFVDGRGSVKQQSHLGVYQSLLHQILPHCPGPLARLTEIHAHRTITRGGCGYKWNWEEEELREFFIFTVLSESPQRPITIFIDALDEMGEAPAAKLIENFQRLYSEETSQESRLRLCFSCRYYPNLVIEGSLSVSVEKENSRDINSLVETHTALMKFELPDRETITGLIIKRAGGIFQWVSLVLDEVIHLRRRGQPAAAVIARIKEVPGTLKGIYDALLVFDNQDDQKQTLKLFQWILFPYEPLSLEDLRQALAIDTSMPNTTSEEITQSNYYYRLEDMSTVVQDLSKGLARVTELDGPNCLCVETIHPSVDDYLLQGGLKNLAQSFTGNVEGLAHFQISRCCIKMIHVILQSATSSEFQNECSDGCKSSDKSERLMEEDEDNRSLLLNDEKFEVPLAKYALHTWLYHVIKAERYGIDQQDLLEHLPWREHCGTLPMIFTVGCDWDFWFPTTYNEATRAAERLAMILEWEYSRHWDFVHFLALTGIHSALDKLDQIDPDVYSHVDALGHTTLLFALAGGNEKIVASAIKVLAHHHVRNERFLMSPLFLAVNHGREDWVQAIITKGADLDQMNRTNPIREGEKCSALYAAWLRKDDKMIRRLLSAGADPSIICSDKYFDTTVIHEALKEPSGWAKDILPSLVESVINLYPTKKLLNIMDYGGSTLSYAIELENVPLVQLLLDSGACQDYPLDDVHIRDGAAFNTAAARGLERIVELLLDKRISPSSSSFEMGPLHEAAANGHPTVVRILLDAGACPTGLSLDNEDEYSCLVALRSRNRGFLAKSSYDPLTMAVDNGHVSVVQAFLDVANNPEADTKAKAQQFRSLPWYWYIQLAVQNNHPDMIQVLLKSGIDLNTVSFDKKPVLNVAVENKFVETVRLLLQYGSYPMLTDGLGVTALQKALSNYHTEIASMLLDWRDAYGRTLVMLEISSSEQIVGLSRFARRYRPLQITKALHFHPDYNFNVQDNGGLTALSYAVIENMPDLVDILLGRGRSDPNTQSYQGETPLMRAASNGFGRVLQHLLVHPLTDIAIEDEDGLTASDHARRAGNSTAMALLKKRQDDLLMERQNRVAIEAPGRGRALPLLNSRFTGFMGTLRRHRY